MSLHFFPQMIDLLISFLHIHVRKRKAFITAQPQALTSNAVSNTMVGGYLLPPALRDADIHSLVSFSFRSDRTTLLLFYS